MAISSIFKNYISNCSYFFKDGTQAPFLNGKFVTGIKSQIEELMHEVETGHPHIYIDPNEKEIDSEALTPLEMIKKEAYDKAKADLLASGILDASKSTTSTATPFAASVANTHTIAEGAAGSDSSGVNASPSTASSAPATATGASVMAALAALKGN